MYHTTQHMWNIFLNITIIGFHILYKKKSNLENISSKATETITSEDQKIRINLSKANISETWKHVYMNFKNFNLIVKSGLAVPFSAVWVSKEHKRLIWRKDYVNGIHIEMHTGKLSKSRAQAYIHAPTLSRGIRRSSEPCLRKTFPMKSIHKKRVRWKPCIDSAHKCIIIQDFGTAELKCHKSTWWLNS